MRCLALLPTLLAGLAGCSELLGVADVTVVRHVGGQVYGLWDGADGVAVRLQASGVDTLLTVSANGRFTFADLLPPGTSYAVTVATNPVNHTCVVAAGGNGSVADADITSISIACAGPAAITLSGQWGWTFDPSQAIQTFRGSLAAQEVRLTISGHNLARAQIDAALATLDTPTAPIALPLGSTTVGIELIASGGLHKVYQLVFERGASILDQVVYAKASNAARKNDFGCSVALSGDTLAVGAVGEWGAAVGINGDQTNNTAVSSGAVYVFIRSGQTWVQQAYVKASNTKAGDNFGASVALSGDTLAVGAPNESGGSTGVNGDQGGNTIFESGAVYVYVRSGATWTQQAYVKASNTHAPDSFGRSVALSGDTLAVGAYRETSAATGINGNQADTSAGDSGAVYVFARTASTWTQQAYLKASNTGAGDQFGAAIAVSGDTLAVGAANEDSAATGINGDGSDNTAADSGAVYVFVRHSIFWSQQAYLKASNTGAGDHFGVSVALSGDTLAVGARDESSAATGVNGDQADDTADSAGAVYVFVRTATTWRQQAYVKASNSDALDGFGASVSLSRDTLAVGASGESGFGTGVDSKQADNRAMFAGAVYIFVRTDTTWAQQAYVKASNTEPIDAFGSAVVLSGDTLAVGAPLESSDARGINGDQTDDSFPYAGAVYVFR